MNAYFENSKYFYKTVFDNTQKIFHSRLFMMVVARINPYSLLIFRDLLQHLCDSAESDFINLDPVN